MKTTVFWKEVYLFLKKVAFEGNDDDDDFLFRSGYFFLELPVKLWEQMTIAGGQL